MTSAARTAAAQVHAYRSWTCPCGRKVFGNGGKSSHRRACPVWQMAVTKWDDNDRERSDQRRWINRRVG